MSEVNFLAVCVNNKDKSSAWADFHFISLNKQKNVDYSYWVQNKINQCVLGLNLSFSICSLSIVSIRLGIYLSFSVFRLHCFFLLSLSLGSERVNYRAIKVSLAQRRAARVGGSWKLTWLPGKFISCKCWDEVNALSEETNRKINSLILFQNGTTSSTQETHRKTVYMPLEVSIDGSVSWLHPFSGNIKPGEFMKLGKFI